MRVDLLAALRSRPRSPRFSNRKYRPGSSAAAGFAAAQSVSLRRTGAGDVGGAGAQCTQQSTWPRSETGALPLRSWRSSSCRGRPEIVEGFRTMTGGTATAAAMACGFDRDPELSSNMVGERRDGSDSRIVCHIGGGLHHAFANHGEGFCPSTMWQSRSAFCSQPDSSASPSSTWTSIMETGRRSSSNPIRACSPSRCISS